MLSSDYHHPCRPSKVTYSTVLVYTVLRWILSDRGLSPLVLPRTNHKTLQARVKPVYQATIQTKTMLIFHSAAIRYMSAIIQEKKTTRSAPLDG